MDLEFHLQKIPSLSPMAAKIALRTLDRDPRVPTEWVMALRPALVDRSGEAASFGGTDWMTIAAIVYAASPGTATCVSMSRLIVRECAFKKSFPR